MGSNPVTPMKEKARKRNVYELFSLSREGKNQDYCLNHHRLILDRRDAVVIFDLFLPCDPHIPYSEIFDCGLIALRVHSRYIQILKSYIRQMVVFFVRLHIEICVALKPAVSDRQVISPRYRHIRPSLIVIKLRPGVDIDEIRGLPLDVLHQKVFVALRSIGTELQP